MILSVENLSVEVTQKGLALQILRGVNLQIPEGKVIGLVGESGCGKSMMSLAIMGLLAPGIRVTSGKIIFGGDDLLKKSESQLRQVRGSQISMIFQDPMSALNPLMTIQEQIDESLVLHTSMNAAQRNARILDLLGKVGIPHPREKMHAYPHELSGGLAQRVMIAMALSCDPKLLIADEPTTALDVTLQSQILELLLDLQKEFKMSILLISHDLALISKYSDQVNVMYSGELVETGKALNVISAPRHPYTHGLLECLPSKYLNFDEQFRLPTIPGQVRSFPKSDQHCLFQERCFKAQEKCRKEKPQGNPKCFFPMDDLSGHSDLVLAPNGK